MGNFKERVWKQLHEMWKHYKLQYSYSVTLL